MNYNWPHIVRTWKYLICSWCTGLTLNEFIEHHFQYLGDGEFKLIKNFYSE